MFVEGVLSAAVAEEMEAVTSGSRMVGGDVVG